MKIALFNEQETLIEEVVFDEIEKALQMVSITEGIDFYATLLLSDEQGIRELNSEFRNIDKQTDVLSFPAYELTRPLKDCIEDIEIETEEDLIFIGDIAICVQQAIAQAQEYGHSLTREIAFLAVHGALHLLGYDHIEDETEMVRLQKEIMEKAEIGR